MKKIYKFTLMAVAALMLGACVGDLDTELLNETESTADTAYKTQEDYLKALTYINAYYSFVSSGDPGSSDISVKDAGQSELIRQYINLNELCADSFKCIWTGDSYVRELQNDNWTATENAATIAVYTRCMKGITLVNEFLRQTTDEKLAERGHEAFKGAIAGYQAEARFHRALFYYILMDLFGNPPFATPDNITGEAPDQIKRADLFNWIEDECTDLLSAGSAMPKKGEVAYPRPTQGSVAALLARMYLNAGVYTGTPRWQDAKDAAAKVIGMGYSLHANYQELFMQDNTETGAAAEEFIFGIEYDKDHAQSWGGTTTLGSASLGNAANKKLADLLGVENGVMPENWDGYHVAPDYVARFELKGETWGGDGFGYDRDRSDKRAFFINEAKTPDFSVMEVSTGWRCWKFSGLYSNGSVVSRDDDNFKFSSSDFPFFRLAEMYLIYAEADARLNGGLVKDTQALGYIQALRDRAGVEMPDAVTLDWLLDERARELMWEGHRRTDLIRYGYFTSATFPWAGKGGVANGKVALASYRTLYPILTSDINASGKKLTQNPGY